MDQEYPLHTPDRLTHQIANLTNSAAKFGPGGWRILSPASKSAATAATGNPAKRRTSTAAASLTDLARTELFADSGHLLNLVLAKPQYQVMRVLENWIINAIINNNIRIEPKFEK